MYIEILGKYLEIKKIDNIGYSINLFPHFYLKVVTFCLFCFALQSQLSREEFEEQATKK